MHQFDFRWVRWGSAPDPVGSLQCSPKLGSKSVNDENERTPEVEPKSINPRLDDEKARRSHMSRGWFSLPNF